MRIFISGVLAFCLMALVACGGGTPFPVETDPGTGSDLSPKSSIPTNYMVYSMTEVINTQTKITGLSAVDINDFENSGLLDRSDVGGIEFFPVHFQAGVYNFGDYSISHYHASHLLYTKSGRIFSIPVYQVNTPKPVQLSKENASGRICVRDAVRGNDYVDPRNSRLIYKVANGVGQCDFGGEWHMVRQSDNSNSAVRILPSGVTQVVEAIHDSSTAKLQGWLVVENGFLKRYDTDFQISQAISLNGENFEVKGSVELLLRTSQKQLLVKMGESVYLYDPDTLANHSVVNIFQAQGGFHIHRYLGDGQKLYLTIKENGSDNTSNLGKSKLFSINLNGAFETASLFEENTGIGVIKSTSSYIYFTADVDNEWFWGKVLKRISKGGGVVEIITPALMTRGVVDMYAQGDNVFVEFATGDSFFLWAISENDSQGQIFNKHHIVGLTYDHKLSPAKDSFDIRYIIALDRSSGGAGDLKSISALTRQEAFVIGRLSDFRGFWNNELNQFWSRGHSYGLFNVFVDGIKKLFYYDAEKSLSLQRIDQENALTLQPIYQKQSDS